MGFVISKLQNPKSQKLPNPTYKIQTPSILTSSATVLFGKKGLLSVDYISKNYAKTQFKPTNEIIFSSLNTQIENELQDTYEFRVGGEYKIKTLSLRAGYRFEQSPYKNAKTIGDLNSYSGGLGYNFGTWKLDLAYTYAERNSQQSFFSQGFKDSAKINTVNNNVSMTLAFEL